MTETEQNKKMKQIIKRTIGLLILLSVILGGIAYVYTSQGIIGLLIYLGVLICGILLSTFVIWLIK